MASLEESSYSSAQLEKLKDEYARIVATGRNVAAAASTVLGGAFMLANFWDSDPFVLKRVAFYMANVEFAELSILTKPEFALAIQVEMLDKKLPFDYRYKMFHLYARVQKFIESGQGGNRGSNIINNGLIIMSDHGTDEEWETGVREQQMKLIASVKD